MNTPMACGVVRRTSWRLPLLLVVLFSSALLCADAALLDHPKRTITGGTVDLTPLFHWWTNHQGFRPLGAWVHLSGTPSATNVQGWVISGQAEKSSIRTGESSASAGSTRFVLRNPPLQDAAEFEKLHQELAQLNAQRDRLLGEVGVAKTEVAQVRKATRGHGGRATRQLHRIERADNAVVKDLDKKISDARKKLAAYPNPDHFEIDVIALDTGTDYNHMPIFDYGR